MPLVSALKLLVLVACAQVLPALVLASAACPWWHEVALFALLVSVLLLFVGSSL
jgi:hypothetical protein